MEAFMDLLTATVGRAAAPFVGVLLLSSPLWVIGVWYLRKQWQHRRGFQAFANARQLTFVGTILSDTRMPYLRVRHVASAVMLSNVIEGEWDGLPIRLFEIAGNEYSIVIGTGVLVTVDDMLHRGARAEHEIAACPAEVFIEMNVDILLVSAQRDLDASELPAFLSFATAVAKAMERDAKDARRFAPPSGPTPPPARTLI